MLPWKCGWSFMKMKHEACQAICASLRKQKHQFYHHCLLFSTVLFLGLFCECQRLGHPSIPCFACCTVLGYHPCHPCTLFSLKHGNLMSRILSNFIRFHANRPKGFVWGCRSNINWVGWMNAFLGRMSKSMACISLRIYKPVIILMSVFIIFMNGYFPS